MTAYVTFFGNRSKFLFQVLPPYFTQGMQRDNSSFLTGIRSSWCVVPQGCALGWAETVEVRECQEPEKNSTSAWEHGPPSDALVSAGVAVGN